MPPKPPAGKKGPKGPRVVKRQVVDDVEIAGSVSIPAFFQRGRDLSQALFEGIRLKMPKADLVPLQAQCLEHWANATKEDLQETGQTECKRDGRFFPPQTYIDRAFTIQNGCKILLKKDPVRRNPYIAPGMMGETGFFDHQLQKAYTVT